VALSHLWESCLEWSFADIEVGPGPTNNRIIHPTQPAAVPHPETTTTTLVMKDPTVVNNNIITIYDRNHTNDDDDSLTEEEVANISNDGKHGTIVCIIVLFTEPQCFRLW
jgi:hypothetical protein